MVVPDSTPNRIIFPLDYKTLKYRVYPSTIENLSERTGVPQADFNRFFDEIQKPADDFNNEFKFVRSWFFFVLFVTCFVLLIPYLILHFCYIVPTQKRTARESAKAREAMKKIADVQNEWLNSRGLFWVIPEQCPKWVELWVTIPGQEAKAPMTGQESLNQTLSQGHFQNFFGGAGGNQYVGEPKAQPQQVESQHYEV